MYQCAMKWPLFRTTSGMMTINSTLDSNEYNNNPKAKGTITGSFSHLKGLP